MQHSRRKHRGNCMPHKSIAARTPIRRAIHNRSAALSEMDRDQRAHANGDALKSCRYSIALQFTSITKSENRVCALQLFAHLYHSKYTSKNTINHDITIVRDNERILGKLIRHLRVQEKFLELESKYVAYTASCSVSTRRMVNSLEINLSEDDFSVTSSDINF